MTDSSKLGGKDRAVVEAFLAKPLLARLATANPKNCQPHVVPVWFGWDGESVWISAFSSTRKVKELVKNPRCAVLVDVAEGGDGVTGVLFEGKAELISGPGEEFREKVNWVYVKYLGPDGVLASDPQSWIEDPENRLVKLTPERIYSW